MAYAFRVFLTVILRGKNPCAGDCSENTEIIDKQDLIDDRNTGHGFRTDPADHNIVQQIYKVCNTVLDHDRNGNGKDHFIKSRVAKIFFSEFSHKNALPVSVKTAKNPPPLAVGNLAVRTVY